MAKLLSLAVVIDVFRRKVVGWAFGSRMTGDLVVAALNMALYTNLAFGQRCKEMKVRPSMGTVDDAYDNAMAESFFASLECELSDRSRWQTKAQAKRDIFSLMEGWYNPYRLPSGFGYLWPVEFEKRRKTERKPLLDQRQKWLFQNPTPAGDVEKFHNATKGPSHGNESFMH